MTAVRAVGLDLSLTSTGMATANGHTTTITPLAGPLQPARRLHEIVGRVDHALKTGGRPDLVVIEAQHNAPGRGATSLKLAELGGAIKTRLFELDLPYVCVPATSLKKWATGKGNASKPEMVVAALDRGGKPANDDEADAFLARALGIEFGKYHPLVLSSDEAETRILQWLKGGKL